MQIKKLPLTPSFVAAGLLLLCLLLSTGAHADNVKKYTDQELATLSKEVISYLNDTSSFQARFEQVNPDGSYSEGMFVLEKPGKILWRYTEPDPLKIVSDGGQIYFEDGQTLQVTQIPRKGMIDLLTRQDINLAKSDYRIDGAMASGGFIHVFFTLKDEDALEGGQEITLTFIDKPLSLRQVVSTNQFGDDVTVTFYDVIENEDITDKLFDYTPPHYREN